jgi:hypothetical protein
MKSDLRPRRWLAAGVFTFSLAGWVLLGLAQPYPSHIIDQFDTNSSGQYYNDYWGSTPVSLAWNATNATPPAGYPNHAGSGSLQWQSAWVTNGGDQIMVQHAFGTNLNFDDYTNFMFDIQFQSNCATDGNGSYGFFEIDAVPAADGWPSTYLGGYWSEVSNGHGWIHVSLPLPSGSSLTNVDGFGIKLQQSKTGAALTGTTDFLLDNLILGGNQASLSPPPVTPVTLPALWQRLEFQINHVPGATNPFDPNLIRLDATFTLPSGQTALVPAFWYQAYEPSLEGSNEVDTASGAPGWRLRYLPPQTGAYALSVAIQTNGRPWGTIVTNFTVPAATLPSRYGYVGLASTGRYFQTSDGQGLPLHGEDVAWPSGRGIYDYDDWFASMQDAGENFARVWMCPWSFGIEDGATNLDNYALDPAWQLDYVLQLAEQSGIYIQLCLDYHGMFATQPDYWGGNNYWPVNPYNVTNGGPCLDANAFFTNTTAAAYYQMRLRYLVGRYGYSQNLLGWEFFNEIDNDYSFLNSTNVASWHGLMGNWMRTNDPFGHLMTTSLTYASAHPEIWSLPQISYTSEHSYNESSPSSSLAGDAQSFLAGYGKPFMIGEFGTSWQGWNSSGDPYLRGFRQGLWGGALGGSVGTAMAWWWQNIDSGDDYPVYAALNTILGRTGWGRGGWTNIAFHTSGAAPVTVGSLQAGGQPFSVTLMLDTNWGDMDIGEMAVPNAGVAADSANWLESFIQGSDHPSLRIPFQLSAWFTNNASLVMHLNSVSWGSIMQVLVDGTLVYSTNLPNLDNNDIVDEEYNTNFTVALPSGQHLVTITNAGSDWFYLDWVQLNQVLPSAYAGNWQQSPNAIGLRGSRESLLYLVAPGVSYPYGATNATLPTQSSASVVLTNWTAGTYYADWYDPATAASLGRTQATTTNGGLTLPIPNYSVDLAADVYPPPTLAALALNRGGSFQFQLNSQTGGRYTIQQSTNLATWTTFQVVTNVQGTMVLTVSQPANSVRFFRAVEN